MDPHPTKINLSPRQLEALQWVARGLSRPVIARNMGISTHTLRGYMQAVFGKLGAHNAPEAVAKASALGLLKECV
jgi:DNA-binding CsgD family transcriptional regulator